MTEQEKQARELRNKYYREYRRKNKDKIREINKRYWEKKLNEYKETEIEKVVSD